MPSEGSSSVRSVLPSTAWTSPGEAILISGPFHAVRYHPSMNGFTCLDTVWSGLADRGCNLHQFRLRCPLDFANLTLCQVTSFSKTFQCTVFCLPKKCCEKSFRCMRKHCAYCAWRNAHNLPFNVQVCITCYILFWSVCHYLFLI